MNIRESITRFPPVTVYYTVSPNILFPLLFCFSATFRLTLFWTCWFQVKELSRELRINSARLCIGKVTLGWSEAAIDTDSVNDMRDQLNDETDWQINTVMKEGIYPEASDKWTIGECAARSTTIRTTKKKLNWNKLWRPPRAVRVAFLILLASLSICLLNVWNWLT